MAAKALVFKFVEQAQMIRTQNCIGFRCSILWLCTLWLCSCLAVPNAVQAFQEPGSGVEADRTEPAKSLQKRPAQGRRAHAHNDYLHPQPLTEALERGFESIEADVFLVGDDLLVAHSRWELRPERTLQNLYLDPLKKIAEANGGLVTKGGGELILLVDFKADGKQVYAKLKTLLAAYPQLISTYDEGVYHRRAVRVVVSGDRPLEAIRADAGRWAGIDGRPTDFNSADSPELMPLISDSWSNHFRWRGRGEFPDQERKLLHEMVQKTHAAGRRLRFWATPELPQIWQELLAANVDLIGTDKLETLQNFLLNPDRSGKASQTGNN